MPKVNRLRSNEEIFELLEKNGTLITANTRLAEYLKKTYAEQIKKKHEFEGKPIVFESPKIFSYDVWITKIWQQLALPNLMVLSDKQSHVIWDEIIQADHHCAFMNTQGLVNEVKKAWKLCCAWEIDITTTCGGTGNIDAEKFYQWASTYKKHLKENHWIDKEMIPELMVSQKMNEAMVDHLIIAGFDHLPPIASRVFSCMSKKQWIYKNDHSAKVIHKAAFISEDEEINAFIQWSHGYEKVACVVPNLNEKRKKLDRFLQRHFKEEEYNISVGYIFSECTMIAQAFQVLNLYTKLRQKKLIELKDFYFILSSPYFDGEERWADVMKAIHKIGNEALLWEDFLSISKDLAEGWVDLSVLHVDVTQLKPSQWTVIFQELLDRVGWLKSNELDSTEHQTQQRWLVLLEEFQSLDLIVELIDGEKALFLLKQMAGQTVFQAQKKKARIHCLGTLEMAGLHFDALWVMGMNDDQFPALPQLNPFIPHTLQRQRQLPHATHEVESTFSQELMKHFIAGGREEVVFSYLLQKEDSPAFESPLIKSFVAKTMDSEKRSNEEKLEKISDNQKLPCMPDEKIRGGTALIKNQALCPFRAFAKHRLKAEGLEVLAFGLQNHDRGNLVHSALESFWKKVKTQQQLLNYSETELTHLIQTIAWKTVEDFCRKKPEVLTKMLKKMEVKRLEKLLEKWMDYEKSRPNFSIASLEASSSLTLSTLELKIRSDRVDELVNGNKIVIDYKTGVLPSMGEHDERPENPQLLLYAVSDPSITAWAFAQVKPAQSIMKGRSAEDLEIPGIKKISWEDDYHTWKNTLTHLANEFLQGEHMVAPKRKAICDQCDLHGLCRIREQ